MSKQNSEQGVHSWKEAFAVYLKKPVIVMFFLGFSAGLPFLLVFSTLLTWLKVVKVDIAVIGYFSWIGLTYSIKVFWAPIVDRLRVPVLARLLGHRRAWMFVSLLGIALGLTLMALTDPAKYPAEMACFALLVAFSSATQDINIDAYRIEAARSEYQAAMAVIYVIGYRIAIIVSGAGALLLAAGPGWTAAYITMAGLVSIGVVTVLIISEPETTKQRHKIMPVELITKQFYSLPWAFQPFFIVLVAKFIFIFTVLLMFFCVVFPVALGLSFLSFLGVDAYRVSILFDNLRSIFLVLSVLTLAVIGLILLIRNEQVSRLKKWVLGAVVGPLLDFFSRFGILIALLVLALILTYRMSDLVMGSMAHTLYVDLKFTLQEIAFITKTFGVGITILGGLLGGVIVMRYGIMRPLLFGAVLVAAANLMFVVLANVGHDIKWLVVVITADNLSAGIAQGAFIAYMSSLVNKEYTATQYALFTSFMTLLGKGLAGFSGEVVKQVGYSSFFIYAALLGIPAILLIVYLMFLRHSPKPAEIQQQVETEPAEERWTRKYKVVGGVEFNPFVAAFVLFVVIAASTVVYIYK